MQGQAFLNRSDCPQLIGHPPNHTGRIMRCFQLLIIFTFLGSQLSITAQEWHSIATHGIIVEETTKSQNTQFLPTSPGEVVIWSDEASVIRELQRDHGVVYPTDTFSISQSPANGKGVWMEQRYTSRRPILYMDSGNEDRWSSYNSGSHQPINPSWFQQGSNHPVPTEQVTVQSHESQYSPMVANRASNIMEIGVIPWMMQLEQRKNAWLSRRFGR
jgi:hypothetical protein